MLAKRSLLYAAVRPVAEGIRRWK